MKSLPLELHSRIFHSAAGPIDDFDLRLLRWKPFPALVERLCIPRLRTAAQLACVCKYWNEIVTPILYQNLIISTVAQFKVAVTTLQPRIDKGGDRNFGPLVKRIVIAFPKFMQVETADFQRLLSYCPALTALHLTRQFQLEPDLSPSVILQAPRTLEVLNLGDAHFAAERLVIIFPWTEVLNEMSALHAICNDVFFSTSSPFPPNIKTLALLDQLGNPVMIPSSVTELIFSCLTIPHFADLRGTSITRMTLLCQFAQGDFGPPFRQLVLSLPPSVNTLSLLLRSWDDLSFLESIPENITFLGLDTQQNSVAGDHDNPRSLVEFCESVKAPALETIQLLHWDDCDHLRQRCPNDLADLVSTLRKRGVDLIDWEELLIV
ncbi:hypothetical protein ONZ45_g10464 [Pleurotus djamor]|nr:hypothetical protein ONZ45_g10464 [Pleurotus djamor]